MFRGLVQNCLRLLSVKEKRSLGALAFLSVILGVIDFIAVASIGLLSLVFFTGQQKNSNLIARFLNENIGYDFLIKNAAQVALICLLLLLAKSLFSLILNLKIFKTLSNFQFNVSERLIQKFFAQPISALESKDVQQVSYGITTGIDSAITVILSSAITILADGFLILLLAIPLFWINSLMTSFLLLYFILLVSIVGLVLTPAAHRTGEEESESLIETNSILQRMIRGYREVNVYGKYSEFLAQLLLQRRKSSSSFGKRLFLQQIPKFMFEFSLLLGVLVFYIIQRFFNFSQDQLLASLVLYVSAAVRLAPSLLRMQTAILVIKSTGGLARQGVGLVQKLENVSNFKNTSVPGTSIEPEKFSPEIEIKHLTFSYSENVPVLNDINLKIEPFSKIAIVGDSGAGKSTFADLILGLSNPDAGEIIISGVPVQTARKKWPTKFAYIPQKATIFEGTLMENIALSPQLNSQNERRAWQALTEANLMNFMTLNDYTLDIRLGENGLKLSGGEIQRLSLARAIYSRAELIVMDEPTSALDKSNESSVFESINKLHKYSTIILIAHNLKTIKDFDKIIYLRQGCIIGYDKFETLRKAFPEFDELAVKSGV